jgi:hypothetical protein
VSWMLPDWDGIGAQGSQLPPWATELARTLQGHYTLTRMQVWDGVSVAAVKSGDGRGPWLVVTDDEDEMRAALGLKPVRPSQ